MPVIVLPAQVPVFPAAGVFAGNVLVIPGATETVPFTGFFVMLTVTGSEKRSFDPMPAHARCAYRPRIPPTASA